MSFNYKAWLWGAAGRCVAGMRSTPHDTADTRCLGSAGLQGRGHKQAADHSTSTTRLQALSQECAASPAQSCSVHIKSVSSSHQTRLVAASVQ